jgi:hypothetical protein
MLFFVGKGLHMLLHVLMLVSDTLQLLMMGFLGGMLPLLVPAGGKCVVCNLCAVAIVGM